MIYFENKNKKSIQLFIYIHSNIDDISRIIGVTKMFYHSTDKPNEQWNKNYKTKKNNDK